MTKKESEQLAILTERIDSFLHGQKKQNDELRAHVQKLYGETSDNRTAVAVLSSKNKTQAGAISTAVSVITAYIVAKFSGKIN
jgi:uncharacterized lipoprotein